MANILLPEVSPEAAEAYAEAVGGLLEHVNAQLDNDPRINELIGHNPLEMMHDNHRNHAVFMTAVFRINSFELLVRTIPWVYRAYHARGFSYNYFPVELVAWQIAIHECIQQPTLKAEILAVYAWMVRHHEDTVRRSISGEGLSFSVRCEATEMQQIFLDLLLRGDNRGCLKLAEQSLITTDDLKLFYHDVIWPSMSLIGHMWESNRISVAEEHLATAVVGRVMASMHQRFAGSEVTLGKIVVCAAPNEFHEVGARMVADFLELDGWDVTFLGANTPPEDILNLLRQQKPFAIAVSVATVFNLDRARQVIQMIRDDRQTAEVRIMIGGLAFDGMPQLWQSFGVDGYAADADSSAALLREWWISGKV